MKIENDVGVVVPRFRREKRVEKVKTALGFRGLCAEKYSLATITSVISSDVDGGDVFPSALAWTKHPFEANCFGHR